MDTLYEGDMSWTASVMDANEDERYMTLAPGLMSGRSAFVVRYCETIIAVS